MMMITTDILQEPIEMGEFLYVNVVKAANVVKDIHENIRNLTGGRMGHYENLTSSAITIALQELEQKAKEKGYDGVIGVKFSHPQVAQNVVEIIAYGNGFKYK